MFHIAKKQINSITEFPINSFVTAAYENDEHRPPTKLHNKRRQHHEKRGMYIHVWI